jgi:glutamate 5-kinase
MCPQTIDLVGKIGSMALIRKQDRDIDYNIFSRLGSELRPGIVWVSSGATEIGRLDYMKRNGGEEIAGDEEEAKADYSAQGQAILMENYRRFIPSEYSVRQLLVEHTHFNDADKRRHIREFLLRCAAQSAVPIVNYNDPVSFEENRRMELTGLRQSRDDVVECIDNDETAAVIATLVQAKRLLILTSVEGIYLDPSDPATLVERITGTDADEVAHEMKRLEDCCEGSSRKGAAGARAKLRFCEEPVRVGAEVLIGHAKYRISDLLEGRAPCTRIGVNL